MAANLRGCGAEGWVVPLAPASQRYCCAWSSRSRMMSSVSATGVAYLPPCGDCVGNRTLSLCPVFVSCVCILALRVACGCGAVVQMKKYGATGAEAIPNIEFWRTLPTLVLVCHVLVVVACCVCNLLHTLAWCGWNACCVAPYLCVCVSLCISLCVYLSLSRCVCVCRSRSLSLSLPLLLCLSFSASLALSLCISASLSLSLSASLSLSLCISASLPLCLSLLVFVVVLPAASCLLQLACVHQSVSVVVVLFLVLLCCSCWLLSCCPAACGVAGTD